MAVAARGGEMRGLLLVLGVGLLGCGSEVSVNDGGGGGSGAGGDRPVASSCGELADPSLAVAGRHFMLWELQTPIETQLQFFVDIDTSAAPEVTLSLVNADRVDAAGCMPACDDGEVCSSLRGCLAPSASVIDLDEGAEFAPNADPPTGYTGATMGCLIEQGDGVRLDVEPFTIEVSSPPVAVADIALDVVFAGSPLESSGTVQIDEVILGTTPSGAGSGTVRSRLQP